MVVQINLDWVLGYHFGSYSASLQFPRSGGHGYLPRKVLSIFCTDCQRGYPCYGLSTRLNSLKGRVNGHISKGNDYD
jgi:hypothetical protein